MSVKNFPYLSELLPNGFYNSVSTNNREIVPLQRYRLGL